MFSYPPTALLFRNTFKRNDAAGPERRERRKYENRGGGGVQVLKSPDSHLSCCQQQRAATKEEKQTRNGDSFTSAGLQIHLTKQQQPIIWELQGANNMLTFTDGGEENHIVSAHFKLPCVDIYGHKQNFYNIEKRCLDFVCELNQHSVRTVTDYSHSNADEQL